MNKVNLNDIMHLNATGNCAKIKHFIKKSQHFNGRLIHLLEMLSLIHYFTIAKTRYSSILQGRKVCSKLINKQLIAEDLQCLLQMYFTLSVTKLL